MGFLASGGLPAGIFGLTLVEMVAIWGLHRTGVSPLPLRRVLATVLAGDFLLLAWAAAAFHGALLVVAGCLVAALVAHGVDVAGRLGKY